MSNISPNPGEMSEELVEALKNANSTAEMQEIQRAWLIQHGAERDRFSPDKLILDGFRPPEGGGFTRTIKINGVDKVLVADSELTLERMVGAAYQEASGGDAGTQPRGEDGKFTSRRELSAFEKSELDLRFRRGEVNAAEYLKATGEIDRAVNEKLGLDPEAEHIRDKWQTITEQWLKSPEGQSWEGGDENLRRITLMIEGNGLEASPSLQTLNDVVNFMRQNHLLVPYEGATQSLISKAQSVEEINSASRASLGLPPRNSNLWGGR